MEVMEIFFSVAIFCYGCFMDREDTISCHVCIGMSDIRQENFFRIVLNVIVHLLIYGGRGLVFRVSRAADRL